MTTASVTMFDWTDYTDFGKGFYVHLEANQAMAYEWARRRFRGHPAQKMPRAVKFRRLLWGKAWQSLSRGRDGIPRNFR